MGKLEAGMEGMLDTFVFESSELLEKLDDILIKTEQVQNLEDIEEDDIGEIFRVMHTIKGSAAMMGLHSMSKLAHAVEDLFYLIREHTFVRQDKQKLYELLFKAADALKSEIDDLEDDSIPLTDFTDSINEIHALADFMKGAGDDADQESQESSLPKDLFREEEGDDILTYRITYAEECAMPSARAMVLMRKLGALAEVVRTIPGDLDADDADDSIKSAGLFVKLITDDTAGVEKVLSSGLNVASVSPFTKKDYEKATAVKGPSAPVPEGVFADNEPEGLLTYRVFYSEDCAMPSARAMVLLRKLGAGAKVEKTIPEDLDADDADDTIKKQGLFIKLTTENTAAVEKILQAGMNVESFEQVSAPKKAQAPKQAAPAKSDAKAPDQKQDKAEKKPAPKKDGGAKHESSMLTVKLEKLDRLLDLVSEIVITEGGVVSSPDLKNVTGDLDRFNKSARELRKLTDELQDAVMSLRMVSVSQAFQKMNRVIRDMNATLGKNVTLEFVGQETEIDKSIVDILGDPLMHIVRNAVDHGIETPEERAAAGKTEPPTVTLTAGYDSGEVVISCTDNGAGMDASKIMAKAKKNGLLTKPEADYTEEEIFNFVVAAGFSTNETVTQYSGRGVGMDVVKKNIEKVGGKLLVHSVFGKGSTFEIRIPLSLSIVDVLNIKVGNSELSIPSSAIKEVFSCPETSYLRDPEGNEFVYLRDMCLPLIRLSKALKIEGFSQQVSEGICIYCTDGENEAVFLADQMIDDQQVVVRPFSPLLDGLELRKAGMAGCSIMGDGSIIISLDVGELIKKRKGTVKNG